MVIENTCSQRTEEDQESNQLEEKKNRLGNLYCHGNIILKTNVDNILYIDRILSQKMESQKNKNCGFTIFIKGISVLIPLPIVANKFTKTCIRNKTSTCIEQRDC